MVVSFAVLSSSELCPAHVLLTAFHTLSIRPKFVLRRDLFVHNGIHVGTKVNRQNHPELFRNHKRGQQIRPLDTCNMLSKVICFSYSEAQSPVLEAKSQQILQNGFEEGIHRKSPEVTYYQVFFWRCARVITFMVLWLIFITFIVGSVITFMVTCYYIYVGYYIYGWFLLHL